MTGDGFDFDSEVTAPSVTELLKQFPALSPSLLLHLAVLTVLQRTVTPQRVCACGCGEFVTGKARCASPACRKRLERQRSAEAAPSGRQFNLVLQSEIPVSIPIVPVPAGELVVRAHEVTPFRDGQTIKVTGYNHGARNKAGHEPYEVVFNYNHEGEKVRRFKDQADAEQKLKIKIDWSWLRLGQPANQLELPS
jgi:hypothetical protein